MKIPLHGYTIVYDGHCKVCTRTVDILRRWDHDHVFDIVASQAPGVHARFPWIPAAAYAESVQFIAPDGTTWQGAAALENILRVLPKGKWIAWVFAIPGVRAVAEVMYRWFARNRYKLGCGEHCQVRPPNLDLNEDKKQA